MSCKDMTCQMSENCVVSYLMITSGFWLRHNKWTYSWQAERIKDNSLTFLVVGKNFNVKVTKSGLEFKLKNKNRLDTYCTADIKAYPCPTNSGVLVRGWRAACWVVCPLFRGCRDTPSEKTLWVTWPLESVWGSCSCRRVRMEVQVIEIQ